ncbi:MAG: hypothetical protein EBZ47_00605 [Chlamydiae bacterium]|nr:hypothetical protein [Chlamydiota bacterium]
MESSEYFTLSFNVPATHANSVREAMGNAGAGHLGEYSFCSFSIKGTGRFKPSLESNPFVGKAGVIEEVDEEKIETVCHKDLLESVIDAIKSAHPYEEMVIDIYPIYRIGRKEAKKN